MTETSVLPRLPFTKKLKAELQEFLGANWPVGLSTIPLVGEGDARVPAEPPYVIVYPLWATSLAGTWSEPDADVDWTYQITPYAERGDQLEVLRDKIILFMLGRANGAFIHPLEVEGMHVINRYPKEDLGVDPDSRTGIMPADMRFGIVVTPAYDTVP